MATLAKRYVVRGHVQGVGFRWFTQECAVRAGLQGWVRNQPDGGVEIHAEGSAEELQQFERDIRSGPPGARVDQVAVSDGPTGHPPGFSIR